MAVGTKTHINSLLKEYFLYVAGTTSAMSMNDAIRAGLTELGFTGSLNTMLKAWANDQSGTSNASISVALKATVGDMVGATVTDVTEGLKEYVRQIGWNSILVKFEDEDRKWSFID